MRKMMNFALMAAMMFGLTLSVTSCKDDDKDSENGGENMEQAASTGGDMTLAESQLASLISNFGGLEAQEQLEQSDWKSKTYETDLGVVLNESRPTVRTIEVGTVEAADEEACALLEALGINYQSPAGFTFADGEVGTVSYQHGGGADANTLAVINLDVKALPGITQLQMVSKLPANAGSSPRYKIGDIIKKKNDDHLWICVRTAQNVGGQAYFISFWTDHPTDKCGWGKQDDIVYAAKKPMASTATLACWMRYILLHDKNYATVLANLKKKHEEGRVEDLMPGTEEARKKLIESLQSGTGKKYHFHYKQEEVPDTMEKFNWESIGETGRKLAPRGKLLCDKFRWSMGLTYDYWVPCIYWVDDTFMDNYKTELDALPAQNEGSHFQWYASDPLSVQSRYQTSESWPVDHYNIVVVATHWQHKYYTLDGQPNQWAVFDFTRDWADNDDQGFKWSADSLKWVRQNITSSELKVTDNGEPLRNYEEVWTDYNDAKMADADPDDESKIHLDEVKMYSIIGTNGKFYDNVQAATNDGTEAMAIVTYLGDKNRVERDQEWNGLAMALDKLKDQYYYIEAIPNDACLPPNFKGSQAHHDFTGWATTQDLANGCGKGHDHAAAKACHDYDKKLTARQSEFSSWFLPSFGQWVIAVDALGIEYTYTSDTQISFVSKYGENIEQSFKDVGAENLGDLMRVHTRGGKEMFWSSTSRDKRLAYSYLRMKEEYWLFGDFECDWYPYKYLERNVLPFIAFKYGSGGSRNQ